MSAAGSYDDVVVGAGPAGGVAAYALAKAGCRVLLLEKETLPRYKACGGALVPRAVSALPFPLEAGTAVVERSVSRFHLSNRGCRPFAVERTRFAVALTMHSTLDEFIVRQAEAAGAEIRDGIALRAVVEDAHSVVCETSAGPLAARFLVGADGAESVVARNHPALASPRCGVALEAEVWLRSAGDFTDRAQRLDFDFNALPRGYGWILPKADHLSAGVFTLNQNLPGLRSRGEAYLHSKVDPAELDRVEWKGHRIPLGPARRLHTGRVLLAGDAAGLVDALTGEGISYAIRSGLLAADCVTQALASDGLLPDYSRLVHVTFAGDLDWAARLARLVYGLPGLSFRLFARKPVFAERVLDAFEGRTTYRALLARVACRPQRLL